jgi:hypothetical protein
MNHLHKYLSLTDYDMLKIHLTSPANVMLMDDENYSLYNDGEEFDYYGKIVKHSPFALLPPHAGDWHLVIEQVDSGQDLAVNVQIISE